MRTLEDYVERSAMRNLAGALRAEKEEMGDHLARKYDVKLTMTTEELAGILCDATIPWNTRASMIDLVRELRIDDLEPTVLALSIDAFKEQPHWLYLLETAFYCLGALAPKEHFEHVLAIASKYGSRLAQIGQPTGQFLYAALSSLIEMAHRFPPEAQPNALNTVEDWISRLSQQTVDEVSEVATRVAKNERVLARGRPGADQSSADAVVGVLERRGKAFDT